MENNSGIAFSNDDIIYQSRQSTTSIGAMHRMGVETSWEQQCWQQALSRPHMKARLRIIQKIIVQILMRRLTPHKQRPRSARLNFLIMAFQSIKLEGEYRQLTRIFRSYWRLCSLCVLKVLDKYTDFIVKSPLIKGSNLRFKTYVCSVVSTVETSGTARNW